MNRTKVLIRTPIFARGVTKFQDEINVILNKGWVLEHTEVARKGFRWICMAIVSMVTDCDCPCDCCQEHLHSECDCACDCCMSHSDHGERKPKTKQEN